MAMRPALPVPTLSRRAKIISGVVVLLVLVLSVLGSLVRLYVDWLWFGEVDYRRFDLLDFTETDPPCECRGSCLGEHARQPKLEDVKEETFGEEDLNEGIRVVPRALVREVKRQTSCFAQRSCWMLSRLRV